MNALVFSDRLQLDRAAAIPEPAQGEALVRVLQAGICATDLEITRGYLDFTGILGHEFVGVVVEGSAAWIGRRVVAEINCVCRRCDLCRRGFANHCRARTVLGIHKRPGVFAEYVTIPEANLHAVPDALTDRQAVFVEPLAAACQILQQLPIDSRNDVTVLGSGRLGLLVAQVLQHTGCRLEVVGRNPLTLSFCEKRGIQTRPLEALVPRADRDVVIDCTGNPQALHTALAVVRPRGTVVLKSTHAEDRPLNLSAAVIHEITLLGSRCGPFPQAITALLEQRIEVDTMITGTYDLAQGPEAFRQSASPEHIKVLLQVSSS